jgi:hypothetical protein
LRGHNENYPGFRHLRSNGDLPPRN